MPVDYPFRTFPFSRFLSSPFYLTVPYATRPSVHIERYYSVPTLADAPLPSFSTVPIHSAYLPACHPENIPDELRLELGTPQRVYKPPKGVVRPRIQ